MLKDELAELKRFVDWLVTEDEEYLRKHISEKHVDEAITALQKGFEGGRGSRD